MAGGDALPAQLPLANATLIETLATVRHSQERLGLKSTAVEVLYSGRDPFARMTTTGGIITMPIDVNTLEHEPARSLELNAIGVVAIEALKSGAEEPIDDVWSPQITLGAPVTIPGCPG